MNGAPASPFDDGAGGRPHRCRHDDLPGGPANGRPRAWGDCVISGLLGCLFLALAGCGNRPSEVEHRPADAGRATTDAKAPAGAGSAIGPWFVDVAPERGIDFQHHAPATPRHLIEETMGSGVAWIDFDADHWPDLLCLQATSAHRLYRNRGDGTFVDVTRSSGLDAVRPAFGAAVGDYDNDGWDDVALTHVEGLTLLRNVAGRFVDATETVGLAGANPHWGTSCAWGDLDGDSFLDLYVCNYVEIGGANAPVCRDAASGLYYSCPPSAYPRTTHRLFWNRRGERFEDISATAGIADASPAPGLAVVIVDLDGDLRPDIYVANDLFPAYLFRNRTEPGEPPRLEERATLAGCALGPNGASMSGMCAEAAEVDGSGRPALFVTNFQGQPNVLFRNRGQLRFDESSTPSGLGPPSRDKLGFGAAFLDADLDGELDLAVANGHVYRSAMELLKVPYAQPLQLFRGRGRGQFRDESAKAGPAFAWPRVGRGVARADFDRDGRPDLAVSAVGGPVALLRNTATPASPWIGLELVGDGRHANRNAVGATIRIHLAPGDTPAPSASAPLATHFLAGGGSYLSAHDRRLSIGLGSEANGDSPTKAREVSIEVTWPEGTRQSFFGLEPNRYWRLDQGGGAVAVGPASPATSSMTSGRP